MLALSPGVACWPALLGQRRLEAAQRRPHPRRIAPAQRLRAEIASRCRVAAPDVVRATPVPGHLRGASRRRHHLRDAPTASMSSRGDLVRSHNHDNMTEDDGASCDARLIAAMPESDMVVFSPADPKYTITVFTDVDCTYCRELPSPDRRLQPRSACVCATCSSRAPGPIRPPGPRRSRSGARRTGNARSRRPSSGATLTAKVCANTPWRANSSSARTSALEGTPASSPPTATILPGLPAARCAAQAAEAADSRSDRRRRCRRLKVSARAACSLSGLPSHSLASAGGGLLLGDHRPLLGELGIELLELSCPRAAPPRRRSPLPGTPARTACNRCTRPGRSPGSWALRGSSPPGRLPRSPCICT